MNTISLLYKREYEINDNIKVTIPTVGEIIENEDEYYSLVQTFTAMPIDVMAQLDEVGIDFTQINEWDLFRMLFNGLKVIDTHLILGGLDLSKFEPAINEENNTLVLIDREHDIKIDRAIHDQIASVLRKIHHLEKDMRKPGNEEAKKYLIERAKTKLKRQKKRKKVSQLEQLIVALVNTEQFKYNFDGTLGMSIYQFNESVRQIINKIDYDNRMHGVYAGTISVKDLSQDDLNWLTHK